MILFVFKQKRVKFIVSTQTRLQATSIQEDVNIAKRRVTCGDIGASAPQRSDIQTFQIVLIPRVQLDAIIDRLGIVINEEERQLDEDNYYYRRAYPAVRTMINAIAAGPEHDALLGLRRIKAFLTLCHLADWPTFFAR